MPATLYKRQREILDYIKQYIDKNSYSPTLQEIAHAMNLSSLATVHEHLQALCKKNAIKKFEGEVRGIEVCKEYDTGLEEAVAVPVIGVIAAGRPIEAIQDQQATIYTSPSMVSSEKRTFSLLVRGDSMKEMGILDGDYVVCEQRNWAREGEVVVALLDKEFATLKKYYREGSRIKLVPANTEMLPIYVEEDKLTIQGVVKGLIRKYQ